jgi:uncharacterized protein
MTNFIPIFPLGIVVFPGEALNLHIFEPRYKQLITDCYAEQKPFGIPTVLQNQLKEYGTLVTIKDVTKVYEDGKMDIKTEGLQVFNTLEVMRSLPEKMYSGAIVHYPENNISVANTMIDTVLPQIEELHGLLNVEKKFSKPYTALMAYDVAHHVGLSINEEYELLQLTSELQRVEYLKRHLQKIIPIINGTESLKHRIQLNGHFKELKGFNLNS